MVVKGSTPESAGGPEDTEDSSVMELGYEVGRGARMLTNIFVNVYLWRPNCVGADQEFKYIDNDYQSRSVGNLTMLFQFERFHIDNGVEAEFRGICF